MSDDSRDHADIQRVAYELEPLRDYVTALADRVDALEAECDRKDDRIDDLEADIDALEQQLSECESRTSQTERTAEAALGKAAANKDRVSELQSRELEKGADLRTDTVGPTKSRSPAIQAGTDHTLRDK
ncbi:hypothetical protein [Natrinema amylolyticum]|uniref:hypothetical protein n=1 Tax=Natrinema amylolyticum TaxID=2878679 RepID=UPI001CF993D1|nr:hypothetical protein [Natrinema amylolyticum]